MVKNHLKRLAVPKTWDIQRKENKYIVRPTPGGSKLEYCMPIVVVFRDMLKKAKTTKEIKYILQTKSILINGKKVKKHDAPVGLMDVVSIPETKESYRMMINKRGKLTLVQIEGTEANLTLNMISNKKIIPKGKMQLNFSNGHNMIVDKDSYKTGDVLVVESVKDKSTVKEHLKLEKGIIVYLIGGTQIGTAAKLEEVKGDKVILKTGKNELVETAKKYAFAIGKDKPIIKLAD